MPCSMSQRWWERCGYWYVWVCVRPKKLGVSSYKEYHSHLLTVVYMYYVHHFEIITTSTEHFSGIFRTSRIRNEIGFELSVICFDPLEMNKPGVCMCVNVCECVYM